MVIVVTVRNDEEDDAEHCPCLFENNMSVDTYYGFLDHRTPDGNDNRVERSAIRLACLYSRVTTILTCLVRREKDGRNRQKMQPDTITSSGSKVSSSRISQLLRYVWIWKLDEVDLQSEISWSHSKKDEEWNVLFYLRGPNVSFIFHRSTISL